MRRRPAREPLEARELRLDLAADLLPVEPRRERVGIARETATGRERRQLPGRRGGGAAARQHDVHPEIEPRGPRERLADALPRRPAPEPSPWPTSRCPRTCDASVPALIPSVRPKSSALTISLLVNGRSSSTASWTAPRAGSSSSRRHACRAGGEFLGHRPLERRERAERAARKHDVVGPSRKAKPRDDGLRRQRQLVGRVGEDPRRDRVPRGAPLLPRPRRRAPRGAADTRRRRSP